MSGLANRLVTAARQAIDESEQRFLDMPLAEHLKVDPYLMASRAAVAAALRELAADEREHRFGYPLHDLRVLAGVVEKGEQA